MKQLNIRGEWYAIDMHLGNTLEAVKYTNVSWRLHEGLRHRLFELLEPITHEIHIESLENG